jgi:AraC-like DNA-binding protein
MIVFDPQILSSLPSYSPQETGPYFARLLTDTKVSPIGQWRGPARLGGVRVGGFSFALIEFDTTMQVDASIHSDHFLMMCCLRGSAHLDVDAKLVSVAAGEGILARPSRYMRGRFSSDCVRLAVRIDPHLLSSKVHPDLATFAVGSAEMKPWFETIGFLFSTPSFSEAAARDPALVECMEGVLFRLLQASRLFQAINQVRSPAASRDVRRAEIFVRAHASSDLSLADMASAADVNVRTLQINFKRYRNMTPMEYLRNARLDRARDLLMSGIQVSDAASDSGFAHQGRFAARYRARFGESPSITLRRAAPAHSKAARYGQVPIAAAPSG